MKETGDSPIPQLDGGDDTSGGGWQNVEGIQSGEDKDSKDIRSNRMPDKDFRNLLQMMEKCFKDNSNIKGYVENEDNELEESSFQDAAKWAMSQKKKT